MPASSETCVERICVDAGFVVRMLVENPLRRRASARWHAWDAEGQEVVAPFLLRYEVTNALYRLVRAELVDESDATRALIALYSLPITLVQDEWLHERATLAARQHGLPAAYDAHYLALAEAGGAEFWTADGKLARSVRPALPWVRLLGEDDAPASPVPGGSAAPEEG